MKIRCNTCVYCDERVCFLKKVKISPNKSRLCDKYCFDNVKNKPTNTIQTIKTSSQSIGKQKEKLYSIKSYNNKERTL